jgi:L-alanine-DL-glutamate epimerase-like enolase superfamily enzyme
MSSNRITRRGIIAAAGGLPAFGAAAGERVRSHPLEGLTREPLRITDVKATLLSCALPENEQWYLDWIPQRYKCWKTDSILVEVFTDAGLRGIGGATQYGGPPAVKEYVETYIRPALLGKNPFDVELLTCGVDRRGPKVGWAGVDAALWDIIGKAKGVSACRLLAIHGKPRFQVPVYASAGEMYDGDVWPGNLIKEALKLKARGFTAYKFRPGTHWPVSGMTMNRYIQGVWKIRDAVGPDFRLIQECNAQWNIDQVMQFLPEAEKMNLLWIEDPTVRAGREAPEIYARIKASLQKVKLSYGGDTMDNRFQYKEWIDRRSMDIVQPDAGVMGLTEAWYVSRMAHLEGQLCAPHNWHCALLTAANATLGGSIPNLMLLEVNQTYNPLRTDLLKEPFAIKDGFLTLPDKPGLGIEVVEDAARRWPFIPGTYDRPRPA